MPAPPDYVDVAERIRQFYERYPDGSLRSVDHGLYEHGDKTYIWVQAQAHRRPEDSLPGVGLAWEPVPGPTPFTRDSEMQNAETSAWGRAIVALGFETKHIASADEVRNRTEGSGVVSDPPPDASGRTAHTSETVRPDENPLEPTAKQHAKLNAMLAELDAQHPYKAGDEFENWTQRSKAHCLERYGKRSRTELTRVEMNELIDTIQQWGYAEGVPF